MQTNDIVLNELILERNRLTDLIAELNGELKVIQKLINRRTSNDSDNPTESYIKSSALKPLQAIEKLFKDFPDKPFIPSEIKIELGRLKKQGLLITQSKNLLNVVHSSLKSLIKKDAINKDESLNPPRYRLKKEPEVFMVKPG